MVVCSRCRRAESEDQPITCVVLGGPCSPCKDRPTIRQKIKQLEEEITKLNAEHHALGSAMNAIHEPFIHKLPPEIGSHIFCLSLPKSDDGGCERSVIQRGLVGALRLGAVCRQRRQLASATPDLWKTIYLAIGPSTRCSLAELLPGLLCEWLHRSGVLPLTIVFLHSGCSNRTGFYASEEIFDDSTIDTLQVATKLVIEILSLHSDRWLYLHVNVIAEIFEPLSGSTQPN